MAQDTEHMAGEIIQCGTIASVDYQNAVCTVSIGELTTGDLPWFSSRAGGTAIWSPPEVGEQCALLAPEGDLENGLVLLGLFSNSFPPPTRDRNSIQIKFPDGSTLKYDHAANAMTLDVGSGTLAISAKGGVTITAPMTISGDVSITGNVSISGTLNASDDVIGGGKSLKSHRHLGVTAGSAISGTPQ